MHLTENTPVFRPNPLYAVPCSAAAWLRNHALYPNELLGLYPANIDYFSLRACCTDSSYFHVTPLLRLPQIKPVRQATSPQHNGGDS